MAIRELTTAAADPRTNRFRQIEREIWNRYGLDPVERYVELDSPRARLRVLEVGTGEPLLFIHGTAGPGAWPSLIRELKDFRCLIVDRPGWGLSSALDFSKHDYGAVTARVLGGVLDGLGIDRAAVVGNSIGNVWALRVAQRNPSRISRVVLLGGGPLVSEVSTPGIIRLIASPIGAIVVRLAVTPGRVRSILAHGGHGANLDAGRLDDFIEWRVAMGRDTDSMLNERAMIRAILHGRTWRSGFMMADSEFAGIQQPTLLVYGTADPTGSVDIWRRVTGLMPRGQLRVIDGAAHEVWIGDPGDVARDIRGFVSGGSAPG
jgi:pimeloyl-ACP methyl ester carboxylesterase